MGHFFIHALHAFHRFNRRYHVKISDTFLTVWCNTDLGVYNSNRNEFIFKLHKNCQKSWSYLLFVHVDPLLIVLIPRLLLSLGVGRPIQWSPYMYQAESVGNLILIDDVRCRSWNKLELWDWWISQTLAQHFLPTVSTWKCYQGLKGQWI